MTYLSFPCSYRKQGSGGLVARSNNLIKSMYCLKIRVCMFIKNLYATILVPPMHFITSFTHVSDTVFAAVFTQLLQCKSCRVFVGFMISCLLCWKFPSIRLLILLALSEFFTLFGKLMDCEEWSRMFMIRILVETQSLWIVKNEAEYLSYERILAETQSCEPYGVEFFQLRLPSSYRGSLR